jgi:hypothetical protein
MLSRSLGFYLLDASSCTLNPSILRHGNPKYFQMFLYVTDEGLGVGWKITLIENHCSSDTFMLGVPAHIT